MPRALAGRCLGLPEMFGHKLQAKGWGSKTWLSLRGAALSGPDELFEWQAHSESRGHKLLELGGPKALQTRTLWRLAHS